jgi:DNA-binding MarR family transcriptional regulator
MSRSPADRLSDHDYQALANFRYALRTFLRFSEDAAREAGLTPNQHQLLLAIRGWDGDGAPVIGDVAERLQLKHHSTVELVQRAVTGGLIETFVDAEDHRCQQLGLTAEGTRKLTELTILHREELRGFRRQMADLLDRLD